MSASAALARMSASVCRTESCRWAAMSARSASRARAARSSPSSRTSLSHHGASTIAAPASTASDATVARTMSEAVESWPTRSRTPTRTRTSPPASRSTPAGVRPPARESQRPRCAASSWDHARAVPASAMSTGRTHETSTSTPARAATRTAAPLSRTTPIATSRTGSLRTRPCRRGAIRRSEVGRSSSAACAGSPTGTVTQRKTYRTIPAPPARASRTITKRIAPTGRSRCSASPRHTPPTQRPCSGRRSGSRLAGCAVCVTL